MSNVVTPNIVLVAAAVLMASSLLAAPAFAAKKTYSNGLASIVRKLDHYCSDTHDRLIAAEAGAEADAGTPAGDAAQKEADDQWQKGADAGCSWAA